MFIRLNMGVFIPQKHAAVHRSPVFTDFYLQGIKEWNEQSGTMTFDSDNVNSLGNVLQVVYKAPTFLICHNQGFIMSIPYFSGYLQIWLIPIEIISKYMSIGVLAQIDGLDVSHGGVAGLSLCCTYNK